MSSERLPFDETFLKDKLKSDPTTWETRRELAHGLYNKHAYEEAAEIIWTSDQIPSTDLDLAFAIRILAKAQPRRAIRLLTAVLELNQGKAVQNMAMANALLHHGMVLQAARFYGAALEADSTLVNPDLEHFVLWSDDECTMWDLFEKNRPKLGQLPWMLRDPKEALRLTSRVSLHTTPISVPELPKVHGEDLKHDLYQQEAKHQAKITPPPAVTIPIDRVDPKDRLFDETYGAAVISSAPATPPPPIAATPPAPIAAPATVTPIESPPSFPARVVFPESPRPAAPMAPAASLVIPAVPVFTPPPTPLSVATLIAPSTPPAFEAPPESAAAPLPAATPFFADPRPPQVDPLPVATPLTAAVPFFADSTPPQVDPLPAAVPFFADPTPLPADSTPRAVSFLGDERLTGSIKLPVAPATPFSKISTDETKASVPEAETKDTIKKADIPQAFPISQSAVPTTLLRVKWSTAPARPGGAPATPPVAAPIPVAPPIPFAQPVASQPIAIPVAPAFPVAPLPIPASEATLTPSAMPVAQEEVSVPAPITVTATGAPTSVLTPPGNPTGPPTRVLTPTGNVIGTPPPPRRLLMPFSRPATPPPSDKGQ